MPTCTHCKKFIDTDTNSDTNKIICVNVQSKSKKWYHYNCFIDYRQSMKKPKPLQQIIDDADSYYKSTLEYLDNKKAKDELYKFIQNMYNVVVLPNYFFIKMESIYQGTYKGLAKGIPATHLLDMWQQKQQYLIQIYMNNIAKGKDLQGIGRVNYDLAILLNLYDGYLKWRESIHEQYTQEQALISQYSIPELIQHPKHKIVPDNQVRFDIDKELDEI